VSGLGLAIRKLWPVCFEILKKIKKNLRISGGLEVEPGTVVVKF
jgi:hypothetical protein